MKVQQLIAKLMTIPMDLEVVIDIGDGHDTMPIEDPADVFLYPGNGREIAPQAVIFVKDGIDDE